jgi:hypothetical protein
MKHTPTPFIVGPNRAVDIRILAKRKDVVPDFKFGTGEEMENVAVCRGPLRKANAEFICLAVNNHDKLLEALEFYASGKHMSGPKGRLMRSDCYVTEDGQKAREAIADVEES